jgi:hypothetical protein
VVSESWITCHNFLWQMMLLYVPYSLFVQCFSKCEGQEFKWSMGSLYSTIFVS